jgi:hypothetical protein
MGSSVILNNIQKVCEELETNPDVGIESEGHVENTADSISESAQVGPFCHELYNCLTNAENGC